jgi:2-polyprenyl-6-methoxyphenol hydroxylase-like FAD-dependent oxidoreductase
MTDGRRVVVAGGGIGGLALGIALRRGGFAVEIVERAERPGHAGSGIMLFPNGVKALHAISPRLLDRVRAAGHPAGPGETRPVLGPDGAVLATDPVGELGKTFGAPQISLLRTALLRALLAEAEAAGVAVRRGVTVEDHADDGDRVKVTLGDGTVLMADVLVGADGIRSGVRDRTLADGPAEYRGFTTVRGRTPAAARFPSGFVAKGDGLDFFAAPVGGGFLYWTAKIVAPQGVWPALGVDGAFAKLCGQLDGWHDAIAGVIRDTDLAQGIVVTDIRDRDPVADWTRGLVTLIGDAAHPMTPALGQGAGMAFEDAVVLAAALSEHANTAAALTAYPARRAARVADVVRLSRVKAPGGDSAAFNTREGPLADLYAWQPPTLS